MDRRIFELELEQYELNTRFFSNGDVEIGKKEFANPLVFFNLSNKGKDYNGTVKIKAINSSLFSPTQIAMALYIVNEFLMSED